MSIVLAIRGIDILHFHKSRSSSFRSGVQESRRFGVGVVASAALWAAFPVAMFRDLTQTGRAYTTIVLCGMVGGGATVLAPSKTLSLIFCALLVVPTSTIFLFLHGTENTFLGILGWAFFAVMLISSRVTNRATMTALRLNRANEALMDQMDNERRRTEATNIELNTAQIALSEANRSLERRVELRTADLQKEMNEKERYARELAHLASTDPLTGLRNRSSLRESLTLTLAEADYAGQSVAVLFLDLNKFKDVNDLLGHIAGDQVLRVVAQRLQRHAPAGVELARWGGDEFVVVLPALRNTDQAINMAYVFGACLSEPIQIETGLVRIDATIGIAIFPNHGRTEENLIRAADVAMYAAKEERRSKIRLFDPPLGRRMMERHLLERALREAVDAETFLSFSNPSLKRPVGPVKSWRL